MKTITDKQRRHIAKVGEDLFYDALARATLVCRMDGRLRAAIKTREQIAFQAALEATGYEPRPFVPSAECGQPDQQFMDVCAEVFKSAWHAADQAVKKPGSISP